jgi:signal transduction histidine kinase/ActR/RegA family two-component response regulator
MERVNSQPDAPLDSKLTPPDAPISQWSVRTFLIWLVLGCLLPGVIGATILFMYQYREGRAQQEKDTIQTARALVQAVDSHLFKNQAIAQVLSTADSLANKDFAQFYERARETMELAGAGSNVVLRDEAGRQILNTAVEFGTPLPQQAAPDRVRSVFATGNPTISDLFIGFPLKRAIMSVNVPVVFDGKVTYVLSVGILPEHFNTILKAQSLPPGWVVAVLDSAGTIVGRNHASEKFVGNKATDTLLQPMMKSPEGSIEATTQEGTPVLSFYSRSSTTNWGVAIGIPRRALDEALALPLSVLAAGVAALFGAGLILAWFMGGRIAHSVKALTAPAMALGAGDSAPVPQVHIREAAEVASAIGRAGSLLAERAATLRAREAELTEAHRLAKFGTWYWDLRTGEIKTSDSIREIFGREVPSFQEQRGTLLSVEAWERVNAASREVTRTHKGFDLELQATHGSGRTIWVNSKCEAVRNKKNEVIALRGTMQDITERKAQEEALRKSERHAIEAAQQAEAERRRLGAVLEATPVGIVVADANGAVLQSNAANKNLWGDSQPSADSTNSHREWIGWWADGSEKHGRRVEAHEWPMARALSGKDAPRDIIEIEPFDAPAGRRIILISGAAIRDSEGKIIGGIVAQLDITDRVKAEEALRQADRRKDEFLAMLAHELRNPLAPISAAADLLGLGSLDDSGVKQVGAIIARQARHMTGLVDDLLDVSRVTRGLVRLEMQRLEVKRFVSDAIEQVKPLVEARRHRLAVHMRHESASVLGDRKRLVQAMTNLLNNAAKFTPEGGEIGLTVEIDGGQVKLTVKDNGIGMSPDMVKRAFELFAQGERTPDRSQGGLGIGLALVKSLVELHDGSVAAYSEGIGTGARFTVCLPRLKEPIGKSGTEQSIATAVAPAEGLKIMVVDDNADAARTLAMFVEALGHQVFVESSSSKALEDARTELPDVCLLDIGLPEMDGNELARRLRAQPETANTLLVAVTGYGQEQDRKNALGAGFDHLFVKPVDTQKLAALLREIEKA